MPPPSINVMLDCGAFSAWRRGEVIDLPAYIEFVKRHQHLLDCYVAWTLPKARTPPGDVQGVRSRGRGKES